LTRTRGKPRPLGRGRIAPTAKLEVGGRFRLYFPTVNLIGPL
jgi:hypothetical protein